MEYSKRKGNGLSGDCSGASNTFERKEGYKPEITYLSFDISLGFQMNRRRIIRTYVTFVIINNFGRINL